MENKFKNLTATALVKTGAGSLVGMYVNSTSSGTITFVDGLTAYNATADAATGTLTFTGAVSDGETVTIGSEVYEFDDDASVTAGNIAVDVSGGATASAAVTALVTAITADSTLVTGADGTGDTVDITAVAAGLSGNDIATTETCANASFGAATLTGGADANVRMNNTITPAIGYHNLGNASFNEGLHATIANTLDVTLYYQ